MIEHIKRKSSPPAGQKIPLDRGPGYTCPELQPNPGIDPARFEAFRLPSIVNGERIYPKGTS